MKQIIARVFTSFMLIVLGFAVTAPAQTMHTIKVNIPFDFNFGRQTFPAGEYSLLQPTQSFLMLRDSNGRVVAQVLTSEMDSRVSVDKPTLRFLSKEGQYSLIQVLPVDSSAKEIFLSKHRPTVAKQSTQETRETAQGYRP